MKLIVLVHGLPGAGKTTISDMLAAELGAARLNADYVRNHLTGHDFSANGRETQATKMGYLCNLLLTGKNQVVVADFVNPTLNTRAAFTEAADYRILTVFMNTIHESRFESTNDMWIDPSSVFYRVDGWQDASGLRHHATEIAHQVRSILSGNLKRYHIRFNTAVNKDSSIPLKWRVIECGQPVYTEHLASSFHISGSQVWSAESKDASGNPKWNVEIEAAIYWEGTHANFVAL